jgi:flagellar secretion chaperone FliS
MFTSSNTSDAYTRVGVETGVAEASPHKLILMLYDGAIVTLAAAARQMEDKDIPAKGLSLSKAIDIIDNGLCACLDLQSGGELAERLASLYEYMTARLLHANLHNDLAAIREVSTLLGELRSAWEEIAADPAVVSANRAAT